MTRRYVLAISVLVGLISELLVPLPGVLIAEVIKSPAGSSRHYDSAFFVLSLAINFVLFAGMAYCVLMNVDRDDKPTRRKELAKKKRHHNASLISNKDAAGEAGLFRRLEVLGRFRLIQSGRV